MGDTVNNKTGTMARYTLGGLRVLFCWYLTSWFLFTFTSTNFSPHGYTKQEQKVAAQPSTI